MTQNKPQLFDSRFEIYLALQVLILFGSLAFPKALYNTLILPVLYSLSTLASVLILWKSKRAMWFCFSLFLISLLMFGGDMVFIQNNSRFQLVRLSVYFLINIVVTWHIIKQVWKEKEVDRKVIFGLISGYISLGFLGFFLFTFIHLTNPEAFTGIVMDDPMNLKTQTDSLLYYSFITLLTIGYGEIVPAIPIAQKAAILIGLIGQFYITIVTAIIVTKYINHSILNMEK